MEILESQILNYLIFFNQIVVNENACYRKFNVLLPFVLKFVDNNLFL